MLSTVNRKTTLLLYPLWFGIACLMTMTVIYLSLAAERPQIEAPFDHFDKLQHLVAYGVLMGWWGQMYERSAQRWIVVALITLSLILEFAQQLSGYRTFDYLDGLANIMGVLVAFALLATDMGNILVYVERKWLTRPSNRQH